MVLRWREPEKDPTTGLPYPRLTVNDGGTIKFLEPERTLPATKAFGPMPVDDEFQALAMRQTFERVIATWHIKHPLLGPQALDATMYILQSPLEYIESADFALPKPHLGKDPD